MGKEDKKNSVYDTLFWLVEDNKIESQVFFDFLEFFWPSFVKKGKYIFLKDKYSEEEKNRLIDQKINPEYWINMLTVDDYFAKSFDWQEKSSKLATVLVDIWKLKLKKDFPKIEFKVHYLFDKETGDYGLTFYQTGKG